jgi:hypothetical protein
LGRRILLLLATLAPSLVGSVPPAHGLGGGACVITGTISFSPPSTAAPPAEAGAWSIGPGQIECNGAIKGYRIFGTGAFTGSGTYTAIPAAGGPCLHHVGTGMVEYYVRSGAMVFHVREAKRFVLAGAGEFNTPSLRGSLQLFPPYEGDCLTKPVTRALFAAQGMMILLDTYTGRPATLP